MTKLILFYFPVSSSQVKEPKMSNGRDILIEEQGTQ
jgi:hypothetical protein